MDTSNYCDGEWYKGVCGGSSNRQCCADGTCGLISYETDRVKGCQHLKPLFDPGFKSKLDRIDGYATACSVTVWILHAFYKLGDDLDNPDDTHSNHLVGHAFDFELDTPRGWCDADCLEGQGNTQAKCFTDRLAKDTEIR